MNSIICGLAVFGISAVLTGIIIPQILLISFRRKLFDEPDERKIHHADVPRLGGIAFMPAIVFSLCLVIGMQLLLGIHSQLEYHDVTSIYPSRLTVFCFGMCSLMIMYLVGMADDLVGVQYRAKFIAQTVAALLLAAAGTRLDSLNGMLGLHELPEVLSWIITAFLVVFIMNATNLIDGIDGLASGLSGIAMAFWAADRWICSLIAFAALGTLCPFFYFNVFGDPTKKKKIFMGDTGSLTTGLILAFLALEMTKLPGRGLFSSDILVVAFSPLAIPCLDVLRVFVHRILRGHSPFLPDRVHIHHKLLAMGIPHRLTMILILVCSVVIMALNMWLSLFCGIFTVLLIDLVVWAVSNWCLTKAIRRRQARLGIKGGYE